MSLQGELAALAALSFSACSNSPTAEERFADIQAEIQEVRGRILIVEAQGRISQAGADVKSQIEEVRSARARPRSEVERSDADNRRNVVQGGRRATGKVQTLQSGLDVSAGAIDDTLAR